MGRHGPCSAPFTPNGAPLSPPARALPSCPQEAEGLWCGSQQREPHRENTGHVCALLPNAGLLFPSQPARPVQSVDRLPRGLGGDANPRSLCYWRPIAFESAKTDSGLGEGPDSEWLCSFLNSLSSLIVHSFTHPFIHSFHSGPFLQASGCSRCVHRDSHTQPSML